MPFVYPLLPLLLILLLSALLPVPLLFSTFSPSDCRVTSLPCVCFPVCSLWCVWACDLHSPLLLGWRDGLHVAGRGVGFRVCACVCVHTPPALPYISAPPHAPMLPRKAQHTVKAESKVRVSAVKAATRWQRHPSPFSSAFTAAFTPETPQRVGRGLSLVSLCLSCVFVVILNMTTTLTLITFTDRVRTHTGGEKGIWHARSSASSACVPVYSRPFLRYWVSTHCKIRRARDRHAAGCIH